MHDGWFWIRYTRATAGKLKQRVSGYVTEYVALSKTARLML